MDVDVDVDVDNNADFDNLPEVPMTFSGLTLVARFDLNPEIKMLSISSSNHLFLLTQMHT